MMFLVTDDETSFLEELDDWVRFSVHHVSPFVALVGDDAQRNSEDEHPVHGLRCKCATGGHNAGDQKEGHGVR